MITYQYKLLVLVISFFISSLSYAEVSDRSLDRILDLSGLKTQMEQFPEMIKAGMEQSKQQGTPLADTQYNSMLMAVDESVLPSEIIEEIRSSLKKSITEEDAQQLLRWYESDLGREITRAEVDSSTPEAYQQMMESAQSLLENTERVEFANRLDALLGATDMAVNLQEYTGIAVYSAIMTAMQPNKPLDLEPVKAQMKASISQARTAIKQLVTLTFVFSYINIETNKLNKYENFLNNSTTKKFNNVVIESMNRAFEGTISKLANSLSLAFSTEQQQG